MNRSLNSTKSFLYLPAENSEMETFLETNKNEIYLYIVNKIKESITSGEDCVELFKFKGTEYYVLIHKNTFENILDKYFKYFMEHEIYEGCAEINKVREKLIRYNNLVKQNAI